jgi:hypothetical protein
MKDFEGKNTDALAAIPPGAAANLKSRRLEANNYLGAKK